MKYFKIFWLWGIFLIPSFLTNSSLLAFEPLFDTWLSYDVGTSPQSVFASDLDGDGDQDLSVANNFYLSNSVSILKNNGDGTFVTKVDYGTGSGPWSVFASDLDGDGDRDLAVANNFYLSNSVSILKNNGDGTFATKVDYGTGSGPRSVFTSDLDGDGDQDLAVANDYSSTVSILKNLSIICFAKSGDVTGDGNISPVDLVTFIKYLYK